jgi:hypothetical protein
MASYENDLLRILIATDNHLVSLFIEVAALIARFAAQGSLPGHPCFAVLEISCDVAHNHLLCPICCVTQGVWETDDVRKDDSFNTFEEILQLAVEHRADFVLLGGDLFHDNKPSRNTVIKAMDILSRYCLNDNPIAFQISSDQTQNFTTG